MLPKPIADPETARIKAKRDDQWPRKDVRSSGADATNVDSPSAYFVRAVICCGF